MKLFLTNQTTDKVNENEFTFNLKKYLLSKQRGKHYMEAL